MAFVDANLSVKEQVEGKASVSLAALLVAWLSIPVFLLVGFGLAAIPVISKASKAAKMADSFGFTAEFKDIIDKIPNPLIVIFSIPFVMLVLAWLGWGLITTKRHMNCELVYTTNNRVLGRCGGQSLVCNLTDVKNVFVAQSLWGKIFNYGNLTISAKYGSATFKNVKEPNNLKRILMNRTTQDQWRV